MNPPIRVCRHTDGRVAVCAGLADEPYRWFVWPPHGRLTDEHVTSDGWSELFVADLPEPDGWLAGDNAAFPFWETTTNHLEVEDGELDDLNGHDADTLRSDALKMLAAVDACEKYQAERDVT